MSGKPLLAALPMYDGPDLAPSNDALWARIALGLRARGVAAPDRLTRGGDLMAMWRSQRLVLSQTCGYPYMTALRDSVVLIAAPEYGFPGCDGVLHRSFLVKRADDPRGKLAAFLGARAAVNAWDSNTGMNLFRAAIAPLAGGRPFFRAVVAMGSHAASLVAVADGRADLAAVDCVVFALMSRSRPALAARVAVVGESPPSPGLPFIASAALPAATIAAAREALIETLADPALAEARAALGLRGARPIEPDDYRRVLDLEREAAARGYPGLV
ncbi:MAG: PhnD/SsuA/transferrin family substrate-binding protein [Hyphomicrobiales bacterium]|nr:PhnD/SsuA/transferrin family substrate-binding protein [Hyphomicrobiales bacterium]